MMDAKISKNLGIFTLILGIASWALLTLSLIVGHGEPHAWAIAAASAAGAFALVGSFTGLVALARYPEKIHNWFGLLLCLAWLGFFTGARML